MSLIEIKNYLQQVKMASLGALTQYFRTDPDMMRCMLDHWIRKGKIRKCMKTPACGSKCGKCDVAVTEIYEWVVV